MFCILPTMDFVLLKLHAESFDIYKMQNIVLHVWWQICFNKAFRTACDSHINKSNMKSLIFHCMAQCCLFSSVLFIIWTLFIPLKG